jgi:TRAP-type mannitol/chloroaromatic compound transport system substrate-binding protein
MRAVNPAPSRRRFLSASALASASLAPAVHAQSPAIRWRLSSAFPKSLDLIYGAGESFAQMVSSATEGRFQISVSPLGELSSLPQLVETTQTGAVQCAHVYPSYFFGKDETFALDGAVPFGLTARQHLAWLTEGNGQALLRAIYRSYGIVNFPLGNTGAQLGGWYRRELQNLGDLQGLKMRITGFAGRIANRLGVIPQNIRDADFPAALERGQIDAAHWFAPVDDAKLQLQRSAPFVYMPSWWQGGMAFSLYINEAAWDALPSAYKSVVEMAAARAHNEMLARYEARNPLALRQMQTGGARLSRYPQDIIGAAFRASNAVYAELSASNTNWRRVFEDWNKFRTEAVGWSRAAEGSYDAMMQGLRWPA